MHQSFYFYDESMKPCPRLAHLKHDTLIKYSLDICRTPASVLT